MTTKKTYRPMNPGMPGGWIETTADRAFAREIKERLPERLFDAHAHIYESAHRSLFPSLTCHGPATADVAVWRKYVGRQVGAKRLIGALCTPLPSSGVDTDAANRFVLDVVKGRKNFPATVLVSPGTRQSAIERLIAENSNIAGFKPYHLLATTRKNTFDCAIEEFLPEYAWRLAHDRRMIVLLHIVRDGALADGKNQRSIRRLCGKYPQARLVLAHSGRGFHAANTVKGITSLRGLENVWFDCSGICEPEATSAILGEFGPRKLMWGSDFPVSQERGRAVTLGTGFAWVTVAQTQWNKKAFFGEPVAVGLESLKALLDAIDRFGLNDEDMNDVFCDNAMRLLGLSDESGTITQDLHRQARRRIPGGVQLLSKRPEIMAPEQWPAYFREARGCEIWDLDGKHYYDCSFHGIGAALLGFRDPDVTRAVMRRLSLGSWSTLNPPEEVALAERLCAIHPWAELARFARTGGEAMAVAVRIARATTDRSAVAVCGYHGWHDWYLAANLGECDALRGHLLPGLEPLGVPRELRGTNATFTYNNRKELRRIIKEKGNQLAAVVMEPCRHFDPEPGFLEFVRDQAHKAGALLIFDEITIGWRLTFGGAHLRFGIVPDIAVFAKTISNGHPMSAIIGTRDAMEGAHGSFISSAYWTESIGPVAALATLEKMERLDVPAHCRRIGARVQDAWRKYGENYALPIHVPDAYPALAHFAFKHDQADALKTLYTQLMLQRGFLAGAAIYTTLAHTDEIIDKYIAAIAEVFAEIAHALAAGDVEKRLKGPVAHSGFRRLL